MGATVSSDGVIDIRPFIRRKQQEVCDHNHVEVSFKAAELNCVDCGVDLDPWWYIRNCCAHEEAWAKHRADQEREIDDKIAKANKVIAQINAEIERKNAEISHLTDVKNKLGNERAPDGRLLLDAARRHRPRKK